MKKRYWVDVSIVAVLAGLVGFLTTPLDFSEKLAAAALMSGLGWASIRYSKKK